MGQAINTPCRLNNGVRSALTLLVLRVLANNHDFTLALDDLALLAHGLHGRSDFHCSYLLLLLSIVRCETGFAGNYLLLQVILPRVTS